MSRRTSIIKALADKLKLIDGSSGYNSNLFNNSFPKLKFWDEVSDFPSVYLAPGPETREYLPSNFTWCHFTVNVKVYVKGEDPEESLEDLIEDIEKVIDSNRQLIYDEAGQFKTAEILIHSIATDEGLLAPYGVGDLVLHVRYQKMA